MCQHASTRQRLEDYGADEVPRLSTVADEVDAEWGETFSQLDDYLPAELQRFRLQYIWIYRNGSRFTHPGSHVVAAFVAGQPTEFTVGTEQATERDLALVGSAVLALGLLISATTVPTLGLSAEDIIGALSTAAE